MSSRDVLARPPHLPLVAPSILSADFARLGEECRASLDAGADLLHLDVMDGHFVPNLTMGPALCQSLREALPNVCLDVHLMVTDPDRYVESFARAGADHLTFHIEAIPDPGPLVEAIRGFDMTAGLAINPPTDVETILPHTASPDLILIMSVNPGFSGQAFIPEVLEKARRVRATLRDDQRLQVDGGVKPVNVARCREAGCDVLVAASAIFKTQNYAAAIADLRGEITTAAGNA